jgi:hypothetical protein
MKPKRLIEFVLCLLLCGGSGAGFAQPASFTTEIRQITFGPKHTFFGYIGHVRTIPTISLPLAVPYRGPSPSASVAILGISTDTNQQYELVGFDQSTSKADMAVLVPVFERRIFRGQFLLIEQEWGIPGRNLLNAVPLLLDSPHLTWDVSR